jgi:flagellar biosynthesis protein FlhG
VRLDETLSRGRRRVLERLGFDRRRRTVCQARPPSVGIASGKGGTGKTFMAVNLAVSLAKTLRPVQLLDADFGLGNAHLGLGVRPTRGLQDYLDDKAPLADIIVPTEHGVRLLPGGSGISQLSQLADSELRRLAIDLDELILPCRCLIVDAAAGITPQTLAFLAAVDILLLVVTPDVTSLTDAYALAKCLRAREAPIRLAVVVNRCDEPEQGAEAFGRMQDVSVRFLDMSLHYLGSVPEDRRVRTALAARQPLCLQASPSPAAVAVTQIAERLRPVLTALADAPERAGFSQRLRERL